MKTCPIIGYIFLFLFLSFALTKQANGKGYKLPNADGGVHIVLQAFPGGKISNSGSEADIEKDFRNYLDSTEEILRTRLVYSGISNPKIRADYSGKRIIIDIPGSSDSSRIARLMTTTGSIEFYETYTLAEAFPFLQDADSVVYSIKKQGKSPLLSILFPIPVDAAMAQSPQIGFVKSGDTAMVNEFFRIPSVDSRLPSSLKLMWTYKPDPHSEFYDLVGLKIPEKSEGEPAALFGNIIKDAGYGTSKLTGNDNLVTIQMRPTAAVKWAETTSKNIGRCIALAIDGRVYCAPRVNAEISGGKCQISADFTAEEAKDLAGILRSGMLPIELKIVEFKRK